MICQPTQLVNPVSVRDVPLLPNPVWLPEPCFIAGSPYGPTPVHRGEITGGKTAGEIVACNFLYH